MQFQTHSNVVTGGKFGHLVQWHSREAQYQTASSGLQGFKYGCCSKEYTNSVKLIQLWKMDTISAILVIIILCILELWLGICSMNYSDLKLGCQHHNLSQFIFRSKWKFVPKLKKFPPRGDVNDVTVPWPPKLNLKYEWMFLSLCSWDTALGYRWMERQHEKDNAYSHGVAGIEA